MLAQYRSVLTRRVQQALQTWRRELELMSRGALSRDGDRVLLPWRQRMDDAAEALTDGAQAVIGRLRQRLHDIAHQLERRRPDRVVAERQVRLSLVRERLETRLAAAAE